MTDIVSDSHVTNTCQYPSADVNSYEELSTKWCPIYDMMFSVANTLKSLYCLGPLSAIIRYDVCDNADTQYYDPTRSLNKRKQAEQTS